MGTREINKGCILLFVKSPEQTTVKSRLAEAVGAGTARELYRNFVLDMLDTLSDVAAGGKYDLWVCFYPPEAGQEIRDWLGDSYTCVPQQGDDLGERMQNAFLTGFAEGYSRILLLGSDAPDLTRAIITAGLSRLTVHKAVIGPACDGGYYLLGLQSQAFSPAIFCGMPWSTGEVYTRTMEVFQRTNTKVSVLPSWRDIDTIADLRDLREGCQNSGFASSRTMRYLLKCGEFTRLVRWFCFMIVVMLFAGCLTSGTGNAAVTSAEVRVGSELEFPPYACVDKSGQPAGFSIELIKAVTDAMGLPIKISTGSWDTIWNSLASGQLDVLPIVAKLPERQRLVDFSLPHTETYDAFFVRRGDPTIPSIAAARGKEIVVMRSDAAHHALLERDFQGKLILVGTIPAGLKLISSGNHDAFLCSKLIGTLSIKEHEITGLTAGPAIPDYKRVFSFAVKKGNKELLEKLNQGLLIVKTSGEYDRIYDKWLSFDDPWRKVQEYLLPVIITVIAIAMISGFWLVTLQLLVRKRTRELAEKNRMLLHAYDDLEARIQERTMELAQTNQLLQADIADRRRVEEALRDSEERYRELSIVDGLTRLYNSRHFYHQLKVEIERADRYGQPLTLLLLDLDDFKIFNDAYGHIEGDQVLMRLGQVMKRCLRQTDSAYRYGGEEFTIILPIATSKDGAVTAERIRTEFKKELFPPAPGQGVRVTLSVGLAQYRPQEDIKAFVHRADQLMYQAKKNGKDRVCSES